jgi:hypothetical protein
VDTAAFDRLTRSISMLLSRRTLAIVLALGVSVLPGLADAKKRRGKKKKKCKGKKKCGKKCIPKTGCCSSSDCGPNGTCVGNVCSCASGFQDCDGQCITNSDCCGGCPGDLICDAGECVCPEDAPVECPGDVCAAQCCTDDDCGANETCVSGICTCPAEQICEDVCCPPNEFCVGGICQGPGTCQPGDNICTLTGPSACNGDVACDCLTRFVDDALICGKINGCTGCDDDADCLGFGGFCAKKVGTGCCVGTPVGNGICAIACPP